MTVKQYKDRVAIDRAINRVDHTIFLSFLEIKPVNKFLELVIPPNVFNIVLNAPRVACHALNPYQLLPVFNPSDPVQSQVFSPYVLSEKRSVKSASAHSWRGFISMPSSSYQLY